MSRHLSYDTHSLLFTNDSDTESVNDDFVSFPTLPDPEETANRSFSKIITKTLRKVTNNASNLVHSYASPRHHTEAPDLPTDPTDSQSIYHDHSAPTTPVRKAIATPTSKQHSSAVSVASSLDKLVSRRSSKGTDQEPMRNFTGGQNSPTQVPRAPAPDSTLKKPNTDPWLNPSTNNRGSIIPPASPASVKRAESITGVSPGRAKAPPLFRMNSDMNPRVMSDNKSLRISTMSTTKVHAPVVSQADITIRSADSELKNSKASLIHQNNNIPASSSKENVSCKSDTKTLQNRISSIFNNLPNDFELSDDSASDLETINNDTVSASPLALRLSPRQPNKSSRIEPTPAKLERQAPLPKTSLSPPSSTSTSVERTPSITRKISSSLSNSLFDSARSIINNNIPGKGSSASSITGELTKQRKKKIARKLSDNPLKNGGIPKKYWMNDSFVTDCLNCFKAFTAFRRKHHCRFCGQIFCSNCTLFISYSQYKHEKLKKNKEKGHKIFNDKLRVCKPCYSDVIVYLSDDSLSSSEEEDVESEVLSTQSDQQDHYSKLSSADHPLMRFRSKSINSRRDSLTSESLALAGQKSNRKHTRSLSGTSTVNYISNKEGNQKSNEVTSFKHAPQMAIPTTRTGEVVEIPVSRSPYSNNVMPVKQNLAALAMRNAVHNQGSGPSAEPGKEQLTTWNSPYHDTQDLSPEVVRPNSLENLGKLYSSFLHRNPYRLTRSTSERVPRLGALTKHRAGFESEREDDYESENEDEKVLSLYTSLNNGYLSIDPRSSLSPTPKVLNQSLSLVPTLHEFPSMNVNDKYIPNPMGFGRHTDADQATLNFGINANKYRSDHRSSERAKASLNRMRQKRMNRLKNRTSFATATFKPPQLEVSTEFNRPYVDSPQSTPTSPTPFGAVALPNTRDSDKSSSITKAQTSFGLSSASPLAHKTWDERTSASEPHHSVEPFNFDGEVHDSDLTGYFNGLLPTIDKVYDDFMHKLLLQSLADCDISDPSDQKRWGNVLFAALKKVYQLRLSDTLDIKQYVKFKKLSGGKIEDTHVVDGLFITKNIDSKRMQLRIENPKIALLMFPLEYLKHKEQFISLRIVNSQQSVYIGNLVSRLVSLEPDVIVVGDTVCGLALKLLEEANVTVLSNVKPQVIERISRYTRGDIFSTVNDLFFKKGSLGTCGLFEIRKFVHTDVVKTYAFFTGCDTQYGFTICLRGEDSEALSGAKYTTETLTPALWNAKFEKSFFNTLSLTFQELDPRPGLDTLKLLERSIEDAQNIDDSAIVACLQSIEHYGIVNYIRLFTERYLSVSPSVNFRLPGVLLNVVNAFVSLTDFASFYQKIQRVTNPDEFDVEWLTKAKIDVDPDRFNGFEDIIAMLRYVCNSRMLSLLDGFNSRLRGWSNSIKFNCYQLYPIFHRSIHVLYSTVSIKHATPCAGPVIVVIDFHTDNDKCLGVFLDQILQECTTACEECQELLLDHYRTYVHDNAKVDFIIERVDTTSHDFKGRDERLMWSHCPECNHSTPITVMTDEIYYLSLGKFFELSFWSDGVRHEGECSHDYFKKQIKYFGYNDIVIRMEYSKIANYEVIVPKKKLESTMETDIRLKIESFERISKKMDAFFKSISDRLNRVKLDTVDKAEAGYERVEQLKERVSTQHRTLAAKLLDFYKQTEPTNYVLLNAIQRELQDVVVAWDTEFNEFEADFLPTENEINKITQSHLRNYLIDKLDHDNTLKNRSSENLRKDDAAKAKNNTESPENILRTSPNSLKEHGEKAPKRPVPQISRFRVPSAVIEDKISQIQQSFENDNKSSIKSPDKSCANSISGDSSDNFSQNPKKVQDLTNYFNQMTLEFQRQREEALEKKSYKYKTLPIGNSLPIVEIYGNIEDVVDVNHENKRNKLLHTDSASTVPRVSEESTRYPPQEHLTSQVPSDFLTLDRKTLDRKEEQKLLGEQTKKILEEINKANKEGTMKQRIEIPQPERNSLLKSLMNYWADRSATLWDPLEYPFDVTEHTFADSDVIVREDEPSSLVAFCLSSPVYQQKIQDMATTPNDEDETVHNDAYQKKAEQFTKIEKKFKKSMASSNRLMSELENIMVKTKSNHLKYQFADGNTLISCKIFYSEQFEAFRKACGLDKSYIQSLSRCIKWNSKGGKSGSNFLKTLDNRYIIKELLKSELESFVSIAPFYFKYISQSTFNTLSTAIAKIFGFYQIEIKNSVSGKTFKMDFLIMENLLYNCKCSRIFDLKGSMRNRHVQQTGKENEVLLDENMIEYIYESPVFVKEQLKKLLRGSLFNDTSFLSAMDVMDYSLVIGIDDNTQKLYVGIIDWLRTFTWNKKVENWVKGSTLVGKKGKDPTIVTPKQYRIRFREAMDRYILEVPDIWYEGRSN